MNSVAFVTDSTADLPTTLRARYRIEVVPALLVLDGREYRDEIDLPRQEFYERLPALTHPPTTAAPSPQDFAARYERLLRDGAEHVFSIHLSSALSSIVTTAQIAAQRFSGRVTVVDSGQLSLGLGFQVLAAAEAAAGGVAAVREAIARTQERIRVAALLDTLEYLRRSGRVSWARAMLGTALSLKPLVFVRENGRVTREGYARTAKQGEQRLLSVLQGYKKIARLAVLHTNAADRAERFLQRIDQVLERPPMVVNVTTVIGTHVGPNGLGFAAVLAP